MKKSYLILILTSAFFSKCAQEPISESKSKDTFLPKSTRLIILGTLQDGGAPHIGCQKKCCSNLFNQPDATKKVVSLGIITAQNKTFLFEASPDVSTQLAQLNEEALLPLNTLPAAVFLTHAHIGHYAGLMYFGKEAMGAKNLKVHALPRMHHFLLTNGPWSQLCAQNNIALDSLEEDKNYSFAPDLKVLALRVPHRDEYSETVGYIISGPNKKVLFIPDIDKWQKWDLSIVDEIKKVDLAFIDGTFYDAEEIDNRDISEIPHPFIIESMQLFENLSAKEKNKIHFIHLNHTNPLLDTTSKQYKTVTNKGFHVAHFGKIFDL